MVLWVIFGLLAAGVSAGKSVFTKLATDGSSSFVVTLFSRFGAFVLLLPVLLFVIGLPSDINDEVLVAVFVGGGILAVTSYCVTLALELEDLSIVSPLLSFVPAAVIVPSTLLVGETPTLGAGFGVVLISFGAYLLNVDEAEDGWLAPIRAIVYSRGAQLTIVVTVLFSVVPSLSKLALDHVDPIALTVMQLPVSAMVLSLIGFQKLSGVRSEVDGNWMWLFAVAGSTALLFTVQLTGYQYAQVSYIQALKQFKVMVAIVAGYYIFNEEKNIRGRLVGGLVMFCGAVLVLVLS